MELKHAAGLESNIQIVCVYEKFYKCCTYCPSLLKN